MFEYRQEARGRRVKLGPMSNVQCPTCIRQLLIYVGLGTRDEGLQLKAG